MSDSIGSSFSSASDFEEESTPQLRFRVGDMISKRNSKRKPPSEQKLGDYDANTHTFKEHDEESPLIVEVADAPEDEEKEKFFPKLKRILLRKPLLKARTVHLDQPNGVFPKNVIRNQKYTWWNFVPLVLVEQFKFFFNLYFLLVALSQFIPIFKVGFLFTYIAPLVFVLCITLIKEAYDDIKRFARDREANNQKYEKLTEHSTIPIAACQIKVGDFVKLEKDQRVPTDMLLVRTTEKNGACYIRTDQLDGETDWKLRRAVSCTQKLQSDESLLTLHADVWAEKPKKDIYSFIGNFINNPDAHQDIESLNVDNMLWSNTVLASGTAIGLVLYTGPETRSVLNTNAPQTKVGRLDIEINRLAKVLCVLLILLSFLMIVLKGFHGLWYVYFIRFMLLFSAIIPISLRVNLDMAKTFYSIVIMRDKEIEGTVIRTTSIPEELGRVEYLFSDKTGTLTQNDMVFKKLHLGSISFSKEALDEIKDHLINTANESKAPREEKPKTRGKIRRTITVRVREALESIALCHNVTPVRENGEVSYQASSPDEIALVKFSESVGLTLFKRDMNEIVLQNPLGDLEEYDVLNVFPFTSETKRMGIVLRSRESGIISFYMKGADAVMSQIVKASDWLDEECGNMAREGLRTLVFGKRTMTQQEYDSFAKRYQDAKTRIKDRDASMQKAIETLEKELELVCLTGVEDKLQENVRQTLETLANAGIKVWMLTGDKIETAKCIAISAKLVQRNQTIFPFSIKNKADAAICLQNFSQMRDVCLLIDGTSLQICLEHFADQFVEIACRAPCVICCRCSPTQKADIVTLVKDKKKAITAAIGDGGNDVSMIQAANLGIGIVGKEGKQASLAADVSINQFSFVSRLLLWHGRNSYKRSARLGQFIIHRGLIISVIQAVFSAIFYFAAVAVYNGMLLVGYATFYTMAPVFSLVLDEDVNETIAFRFPELYRELQRGRALSYKTFFIWVFTSVYQGGMIMLLTLFLFETNLLNVVTITYTALILTELLNVAFEVHTWNRWMILSQVVTVLIYFGSIFILKGYFDTSFVLSWGFVWRVSVVTMASCLPLFLVRFIRRKIDPPSYTKLS